MVAFNKFHQFVEDMGKGVHQLHAAGHTLKAYLTLSVPDASGEVKANVPEIANENGYAAPIDIQNDYTQTGGVASLTGVDIVITATGNVGPFRCVVIYNEDPVSPVDPLVAWYDYASEISLADGQTFTIDFGATVFTNE